ncbi:MAG: hypothetical protein JWL94_1575 [Microbacteriaceae bacterium]|nr:hypothetical protein [Microbacteriaceae bacterium]
MPGITPPVPLGESDNLARGIGLSFAGAATSALMGFALTFVLTRSLGDSGAGIALQAIAVFMIALSVAKLGMDSVAIWIFPRLILRDVGTIRSTVILMGLATLVGGTVSGLAVVFGSSLFASSGDEDADAVAAAVSAVGWFIPAAALALVALAITRGFGGIRAFVTIGSVAMPSIRVLVAIIAAAAGGSAIALSVAWASVFPAAFVAASIVVVVQIRRLEARSGRAAPPRRDRAVPRTIGRYAVPRTISAALEQSMLWSDVIIVGLIAGSASAGVYGGAVRLVAAGLIVDTAIRAVVSTRFSALLFEHKTEQVQALYRTAATWLVLFSSPIYVVLAIFAPVVLGWFGPDFERGSWALVILCAGATVTFMAGNVHSMLLMSGRSGLAAMNKAIALTANVTGNLVLIPAWGIQGAAVSWSVSMLIDAALAAIEVRRGVGIRTDFRMVAYALIVPVVAFGIPAMAFKVILGANEFALLLALVVGGAFFIAWCFLDRDRLHLHELIARFRRR